MRRRRHCGACVASARRNLGGPPSRLVPARLQALHDAEHAIKLEPEWAKPRSRKALAHLHLHQYEQAIQAYKVCIKLEPQNENYKVALKEAQHRLARQKDPKASVALRRTASSASRYQPDVSLGVTTSTCAQH